MSAVEHVPVETVEGEPRRTEISPSCRDGNHRTCREIGFKCACKCPPGSKGHGMAEARVDAAKEQAKASSARKVARRQAIDNRVRDAEEAVLGPKDEPKTPHPANGKVEPLIKLVKAEPPAREKKRYTQTISERVRPLLEEILVAEDHDWYRAVLFYNAKQAASNVGRLRKHFSQSEWEWDHATLEEVNQSAVYVRWKGTKGTLV